MRVDIDEHRALLAFCEARDVGTWYQRRALKLICERGSQAAAAKEMGKGPSSVSESMAALRAKAAILGFAPTAGLDHPVAEGFKVKRHSRMLVNGVKRAEWVISSPDREKQEALLRAAVAALASQIEPVEPKPRPEHGIDDLATQYTITDYHCGMLAWGREAGADWNLGIAEDTLTRCYQYMVDASPPSRLGIVCQLGDFLHYDGLVAKTPTSEHPLDADSRFEKMVEVGIRLVRRVVDMTLAKHDQVHVIMAEGNHDLASSVWLRQLLHALYEKEPRVTVERSPLPYYAVEHGDTMLAYHHGHLKKRDTLSGLFAAQFSEIWGRTKFRYAHCGHLHHHVEREDAGMTIIQHRTLAARDAYAARGGYHSERKASAITYHRRHGEVSRIHVAPEMTEHAGQ